MKTLALFLSAETPWGVSQCFVAATAGCYFAIAVIVVPAGATALPLGDNTVTFLIRFGGLFACSSLTEQARLSCTEVIRPIVLFFLSACLPCVPLTCGNALSHPPSTCPRFRSDISSVSVSLPNPRARSVCLGPDQPDLSGYLVSHRGVGPGYRRGQATLRAELPRRVGPYPTTTPTLPTLPILSYPTNDDNLILQHVSSPIIPFQSAFGTSAKSSPTPPVVVAIKKPCG